MKVVLSRAAKADLISITDFIARDNPLAAQNFVAALRAKALGLGQAPYAFPLAPRYASNGIRRRVWRNYLIFYRVETDQVSIVRIIHGARDYERLLFPNS